MELQDYDIQICHLKNIQLKLSYFEKTNINEQIMLRKLIYQLRLAGRSSKATA